MPIRAEEIKLNVDAVLDSSMGVDGNWLDLVKGKLFDGLSQNNYSDSFIYIPPKHSKKLVILCRPGTHENSTIGFSQSFWGALLDSGAYVLSLRDRSGLYYTAGMAAIGSSLAENSSYIRKVMDSLGLDTVVTAASSGGGPGAIYLSAALGAKRCVLFSPLTAVETNFYAERVQKVPAEDVVVRRWKRLMTGVPIENQFLGNDVLSKMENPCQFRVHYPTQRFWDSEWALLLKDVPGMCFIPYETCEHALLKGQLRNSVLAKTELIDFLVNGLHPSR